MNRLPAGGARIVFLKIWLRCRLPPFDDLDALAAADTPTVQSAWWWITHQASSMSFNGRTQRFPQVDRPDHRIPSATALRDRHGASAVPRVTVCWARPGSRWPICLEHRLERHRHRIVRVHEQLPPSINFARSDTRSMAWPARQPGKQPSARSLRRTHARLGGQARRVCRYELRTGFSGPFSPRSSSQRAGNRPAFTSAADGTAVDSRKRVRQFR